MHIRDTPVTEQFQGVRGSLPERGAKTRQTLYPVTVTLESSHPLHLACGASFWTHCWPVPSARLGGAISGAQSHRRRSLLVSILRFRESSREFLCGTFAQLPSLSRETFHELVWFWYFTIKSCDFFFLPSVTMYQEGTTSLP